MSDFTDVDAWIEDEVRYRIDGPEQRRGRAERLVGDFYEEDGTVVYEPSAPSHLVGQANHRIATLNARLDDDDISPDSYETEAFLTGVVLGYEVAEAGAMAHNLGYGADKGTVVPHVQDAADAVDAGFDGVQDGFTSLFTRGMRNAGWTIAPGDARPDEEQKSLEATLMPE
ncbi:MAG: hypothetical protein SVU88_00030 [Candidatus Nanohaloarchaea archaeon]|nr:hypothetical protein [Candidatus Nanohaloarchaea archaeon]